MDLKLEPMEPCFDLDEEDNLDPGDYQGIERRQMHRRSAIDRRVMVRFEPGKEDRRSGRDRRAGQSLWSNLYNI